MGGEFLDTDEERTGTSVPLLLDLSLPSMEVALQRPASRPDLAFFLISGQQVKGCREEWPCLASAGGEFCSLVFPARTQGLG